MKMQLKPKLMDRLLFDKIKLGIYVPHTLEISCLNAFASPINSAEPDETGEPEKLQKALFDYGINGSCKGTLSTRSFKPNLEHRALRASVPEKRLSNANNYTAKPFDMDAGIARQKPEGVALLEEILSNAYEKLIRITRVKELPSTRKDAVKEISYSSGDGAIYKVWVFKADPKETVRELNTYYVAYNAGVPTGKPIGYSPNASNGTYPFDVAILGGVINYVGNSYNDLIKEMPLAPDLAHLASLKVAKLIADYHVKLTLAKGEFKKYGIYVPKFSVRHEISERLFRALNICEADEPAGKELVLAFEALEKKERCTKVISHNDIHTRNILSIAKGNEFGQIGNCYERFGVIDWGEIAYDKPHGDLLDFWAHHKRDVYGVCGDFDFSFDDFEREYESEFNRLGEADGLRFEAGCFGFSRIVKSAMWNLFEMYDPVRKEQKDIEQKAVYHARLLWDDLSKISGKGYGNEADSIKKSIVLLLKDKMYLNPVLCS